MSLRPDAAEAYASSPPLLDWVANLVLKLPADARLSLKVESLPVVGFTDQRHSGHVNQDRIAVAYSTGLRPASNWLLALVCDGVGGSSHGESAASTAIAAIALEVATLRSLADPTEALRRALHHSHLHTAAAFQSKSSTTAVALLVTETGAALGWVGDSRGYEIASGEATLLTTDDTLAAATARANPSFKFELNEEYGDRLSQAIGGMAPVHANVIAWRPSSDAAMCLLCTDGIWKPTEVALPALVSACHQGPELMRRLLLVSDWMGGMDNASAVLVPPLGDVRDFLADPANATPSDFMLLCLPGYLQTLLPVEGRKVADASALIQHDRAKDYEGEPAQRSKKATTKRKIGGSAKGESRSSLKKLGKQLVIAEEPPDEESTDSPGKVQGDQASI